MQQYDVAVIGGGVVGCAVAWRLARYKLRVALLESGPDIAMGATKANSAIVHGGYAEGGGSLKGQLCYKGRTAFSTLDEELHFGFKKTGSLVLAFEEDGLPALEKLKAQGEANGLPDLRILGREEVLAIEPGVNPDVHWALHCAGAGVCSPFGLAVALAENAIANGTGLWLDSEVAAIANGTDGLTLRLADGRALATRYAVNAAGFGAAAVAGMVGDDSFAIHPRSGEYILLNNSGEMVNTVLFQLPTRMGKGILVAPSVFGNLLLGPDAIDEMGYDRNTHAARLYDVYTKARQSVPGVDLRRFLRSFAGVRAVSDTNDFIIRPSHTQPRLVHAAGIQSPGLTASPAIAQMVEELLAEAGLALEEKEEYIPHRQGYGGEGKEKLPPDALKPLLDLPEGAPGRVLCRCEQVPEQTARAAACSGIPLRTVDAIKRRTQAGMGWCQGAFCRPRTAALLSHLGSVEADARQDIEREGIQRVGRDEMLAYAAAQEQEEV